MLKFKLLLLLCGSTLFFQCTLDDNNNSEASDDEPSFDLENSVVINVPSGYFDGRYPIFVYLSDTNGTIVVNEQLQNNTQTVLSGNFDSETYHLTVVHVLNSGQTVFIDTFMDIQPTVFNYKNIEITSDVGNDFTLQLTNASKQMEILGITGGYAELNFVNETTLVKGYLQESPGNFFMMGKLPNEQTPRYYWANDKTGGESAIQNFTDLPQVSNVHALSLPEHSRLEYSVSAWMQNEPDETNHLLAKSSSISGDLTTNFYIPANHFDFYKTGIRLNIDNGSYGKLVVDTHIPSQISLPAMDIEVISADLGAYSASTNGVFDYFATSYNHIKNGQLSASYTVYGAPSNTLNFNMQELISTLLTEFVGFDASELTYENSIIFKYGVHVDYNDIIKFYVGGNSDFPELFSVENIIRY